jgi:hypothetical protein
MNKILKLSGMFALALSAQAHAQTYRYNFVLSDSVPYDWVSIDSTYGEWTNSGSVYNCTNWSPSTATIGKGVSFTQDATDCKQDQTRTGQKRHQDSRTGNIQNDGDPFTENRTIAASSQRSETGILENWSTFAPSYTDWKDTNALYGCTSWSPDPSIYTATTSFTQSSSSCSTDQTRQRQDREQEQYTQEIRNDGSPVTENQTLTSQKASRPYSVILGEWTNTTKAYDCSNWSPDPSTVGKGVTFSQSASDCKVDAARTRAESYIDHKTSTKINVAKPNETKTLTGQSDSRTATGTLENWVATDSVYGAWTNITGKVLYSCSNWSPAGSTKTTTTTFAQTATDCKTDQSRTRQDRELETNTQEVRNKGDVVTEAQTLSSQGANRSYTVSLTGWTNNGAVTSCSNWSPDPSTVTISQTYTQTATDCLQPQTRTRAESYVDHLSGATVQVLSTPQSQSIAATSTRSAVGTKETWQATSSTYSAWVNSTDIAGCTAWSPSPSNYTVQTQFTQTGTGCSVTQTRSRQDRQIETTTGAVRNNGAAVTESQTIGGQSTTRTYLMDFSGWSWSGDNYGCTGWSPDVSTVNSGTSFTQTATCTRNQTRGAAGYTWTGTWTPDPAVPYRTETQAVGGQVISQTAVGTKSTCQYVANQTYWMILPALDHNVYVFGYLNGAQIYSAQNVGQTGFYYGGKLYTRGTQQTGTYYSLCLP